MTDWNKQVTVTNVSNTTPYSATNQNPESASPVDHSGSATTSPAGNTVSDNDVLNNVPPRVNQQQVIPSAVKSRLLGDLFTNQPADLTEAFFANDLVPDSTSVSFLFTIADPQGREIFVSPYIAFFITSDLDTFPVAANLWPNQTFGEGNMPTSVFNDLGSTNGITNSVTRATMRNNTGSTQAVWCFGNFRVIANPSQPTGNV